jgi:hypothetical protein
MGAVFTDWEEIWFAAGDDDEARARRSANDWDLLIRILGSPFARLEQDEWEAAIRRAKLAIRVSRAA